MSAAEVIALIEKLPAAEREEVLAHFRTTDRSEKQKRTVSNEEFERAAKRVFRENSELLRRLAR